jgi:hypothetical protein
MPPARRTRQDLQPECENCDFFKRTASGRRLCAKHTFLMPLVDWQILCKDWRHEGKSIDLRGLKPDTLYYYSSASGKTVRAEIASFEQLQRLVLSASVRHDNDLGWVIVPRHYQAYFPAAETLITVRVGDRKSKFHAVNSERKIAVEMIPVDEGEWETSHHTGQVYMLASMESPDLLYDWMNSFMDLEAFLAQSFAPSLVTFVEVIREGSEYAIHADILPYQQYLR